MSVSTDSSELNLVEVGKQKALPQGEISAGSATVEAPWFAGRYTPARSNSEDGYFGTLLARLREE
jgi:hypothetical protein